MHQGSVPVKLPSVPLLSEKPERAQSGAPTSDCPQHTFHGAGPQGGEPSDVRAPPLLCWWRDLNPDLVPMSRLPRLALSPRCSAGRCCIHPPLSPCPLILLSRLQNCPVQSPQKNRDIQVGCLLVLLHVSHLVLQELMILAARIYHPLSSNKHLVRSQ